MKKSKIIVIIVSIVIIIILITALVIINMTKTKRNGSLDELNTQNNINVSNVIKKRKKVLLWKKN